MKRSKASCYLSPVGELGFEAAFPFPFPLAAVAAAAADGSSDLREEADGGRLRVRRPGSAAEAAALIAVISARAPRDAAAAAAAGAVGAGWAGGFCFVSPDPPGSFALACGNFRFCPSSTGYLHVARWFENFRTLKFAGCF